MTATTLTPTRLDLAPDPLKGLEAELSFGQAYESLGSEIQANNGVPTVDQFLEAEHALTDLKPKYQIDHEGGELRLSHYLCPDGSRVSAKAGSSLKVAANLKRWVQSEQLESDFLWAAHSLRSEGPDYDSWLEGVLPVIDHATSHLKLKTDLDAGALERMAAISRFARRRLTEQGVDVTRLLNERDERVVASSPVAAHSRRHSHQEHNTPPYGIPRVAVIREHGKMIGRATVNYDKRPDEMTLRQLLEDDIRGDAIRHAVFDKYGMDRERLDEAGRMARRLAIFDKMERHAYRTRQMPEFAHVMESMFPDREHYTTDDVDAALEAMTRLRYASERHMLPNGAGRKFKSYVGMRDLAHRGGKALARFAERQRVKVTPAFRSIGAVVLSRIMPQGVGQVAPAVSTDRR